ncbi:MAG: c-type cytochrome [Candidatus Hydrogenedentes bacterium]|nr:c-type cytochrome [Candidatus Hydrogenedentota bacterium]
MRNRMRQTVAVIMLAAIALLLVFTSLMDRRVSAADETAPPTDTAATTPDLAAEKAAQIERGRYLANSVAMCVVCHSPKDHEGNPIREHAFMGGVIPAKATYPDMQPFASNAPALGPMVGGVPEDVAHLLQTGIWRPTNSRPRPPMPPFRLSDEDAEAVVAYLRSLQ